MPSRSCPVCRKTFTFRSVSAHTTFPFCSERCRLIDLGAWFAGEHQIVEEMHPADVDEALHEMIDATDGAPREPGGHNNTETESEDMFDYPFDETESDADFDLGLDRDGPT